MVFRRISIQNVYSLFILFLIITMGVLNSFGDDKNADQSKPTRYGTEIVNKYLENQVIDIAHRRQNMLSSMQSVTQWEGKRPTLRQQLREMIGLSPLPEKTDLQVTVTGVLQEQEFIVEKLHYQSMPGLYVTANFYLPKEFDGPLPTILYLCGHGNVEIDGVSYGSKAAYQKHPAWYASHGYAALILDTHQLGEVPGIHHGLKRFGYWDWNARGYTPLGVEIWNAIRALDYLETRPEVDMSRIAATGRSGGGVYTWYLSALDERIAVAVPTSSMADSREDVLNKMHTQCDCTKFPNTYQWDLFMTGTLIAPRPLMVAHTDHGNIHAIDGVQRLYNEIHKIYRLYNKSDHIDLLVTAGPHKDTPALRLPTFRWMNRWLKGDNSPVTDRAKDYFEPQQLRVFAIGDIPDDQINSSIYNHFNELANIPDPPKSDAAWQKLLREWKRALQEETFLNWPGNPMPSYSTTTGEVTSDGMRLSEREFNSQNSYRLRIWWLQNMKQQPERLIVHLVDESEWRWGSLLAGLAAAYEIEQLETMIGPGMQAVGPLQPDSRRLQNLRRIMREEQAAYAIVPTRGVGPTRWDPDLTKIIRRKFMALGQTVDGMRVWDARRALQVLRQQEGLAGLPVELRAAGRMAGIALHTAIFEPDIAELRLTTLPTSHLTSPIFFRIAQVMDVPQALAMVLPDTRVRLADTERTVFQWTIQLMENLNWRNEVLTFH